MEQRIIERFQETLYTKTFSNGLRVVIVPKPDFTRTYVTATLRFGSKHLLHPDGQSMFPAGIAHFLEHKMFETPDGDGGSLFAHLGASTNAFTSFDKTTYLFRTIDHVKEATTLLLDMIQSITIDKNSVEKEIGIIQEEIQMYEDMPDSVLFWRTMHNLFVDHPLSYDIAGSVESVAQITVEALTTCHQTYYHPKNTLLVMVGPIDPQAIEQMLQANQSIKQFPDVTIPPAPAYDPKIRKAYDTITHLEAADKLMIAYKQSPDIYQESFLKYRFAMMMYLDILFGESSDFYERNIEAGVINDSFSAFSFIEPDMGLVFFGGDSKKPDVLFDEIEACLQTTLFEEEVKKVQRRLLGGFIRGLHSLESMAHDITNYDVLDADVFEAIHVIESLTVDDVRQMKDFFDDEQKTITMLHGKRH
jgi:predicted Zn-dependent peptidase